MDYEFSDLAVGISILIFLCFGILYIVKGNETEKKRKQAEKVIDDELLRIEMLEKRKLSKIGVIEKHSIAQAVILSFPNDKFEKIIPMLDEEVELRKAAWELNEKLISRYEELLLVELGDEEPHISKSEYEPILNSIIEIGYKEILKKYMGKSVKDHGDLYKLGKREISHGSSWAEIKKRL